MIEDDTLHEYTAKSGAKVLYGISGHFGESCCYRIIGTKEQVETEVESLLEDYHAEGYGTRVTGREFNENTGTYYASVCRSLSGN